MKKITIFILFILSMTSPLSIIRPIDYYIHNKTHAHFAKHLPTFPFLHRHNFLTKAQNKNILRETGPLESHDSFHMKHG